MFSISKLLQNIPRLTMNHLVIGGVFTLALAGSVGLGMATRGHINAAVIRDTDSVNSIDGCNNGGGIGAADAAELISDIKVCGGDLPTVYSHFNLTPDKYQKFIDEAKEGVLYRDGHVTVEGQTVMNNALTLGRTSMGKPASVRKPVVIGGKTYYQSTPEVSFASGRQSLPVMVMFDDQGVAKTVIMNACGNGVEGTPVVPGATCDALQSTQPDKTNKPNTHVFTTKATLKQNTTLSRVVYHFSDDNTTKETKSLTEGVEHTFKKDGKVTVKVYVKVPGGKEIEAASVHCEKQVKYVPPFYVCTALVATAIDQQKRNFRFTVKTSSDKSTTVKSVDFTLDKDNVTTGVADKDDNGNIYKEYKFTDEKEHTVVAKVNFNTVEGVKSITCEAKVTPSKLPKCEVPGFENLPPNDERCGYCKPNIPKGDKRCEDQPQVLAATGPANIIGLFAGTSIAGALGHRFYTKRRTTRA